MFPQRVLSETPGVLPSLSGPWHAPSPGSQLPAAIPAAPKALSLRGFLLRSALVLPRGSRISSALSMPSVRCCMCGFPWPSEFACSCMVFGSGYLFLWELFWSGYIPCASLQSPMHSRGRSRWIFDPLVFSSFSTLLSNSLVVNSMNDGSPGHVGSRSGRQGPVSPLYFQDHVLW